MNKMEELELLTGLQNLSIGTSSHDGIEVYCPHLQAKIDKGKEGTLETDVRIKITQSKWKETSQYLEELLSQGRIDRDIEAAIISKIKSLIIEKIQTTRKEAKEILGIPGEGTILEEGRYHGDDEINATS